MADPTVRLTLDGPTAAKLESMLRDALVASGAYIRFDNPAQGSKPDASVRLDTNTVAKLAIQMHDALVSAKVIDPKTPVIKKRK